jgi:hypothetical protein
LSDPAWWGGEAHTVGEGCWLGPGGAAGHRPEPECDNQAAEGQPGCARRAASGGLGLGLHHPLAGLISIQSASPRDAAQEVKTSRPFTRDAGDRSLGVMVSCARASHVHWSVLASDGTGELIKCDCRDGHAPDHFTDERRNSCASRERPRRAGGDVAVMI